MSLDLCILGGMGNKLWRSKQALIPNPWYFNLDNAETPGNHQLGHAELLAAAYMGWDLASYAKAIKSVDAK